MSLGIVMPCQESPYTVGASFAGMALTGGVSNGCRRFTVNPCSIGRTILHHASSQIAILRKTNVESHYRPYRDSLRGCWATFLPCLSRGSLESRIRMILRNVPPPPRYFPLPDAMFTTKCGPDFPRVLTFPFGSQFSLPTTTTRPLSHFSSIPQGLARIAKTCKSLTTHLRMTSAACRLLGCQGSSRLTVSTLPYSHAHISRGWRIPRVSQALLCYQPARPDTGACLFLHTRRRCESAT